jgi:hypothetical protein
MLEGLKPSDKVLIIEDQTIDHSNDQTYQPINRMGYSDQKNRRQTIKAKDYPLYVQTQIEKENEVLKETNQAIANNYAALQAQLAEQQAQLAMMMKIMQDNKLVVNTEPISSTNDAQVENESKEQYEFIDFNKPKEPARKPLLGRK